MPRDKRAPVPAKKPPTSWLDDLQNLYYVNSHGPPRTRTKFLYVVHLFSGTKRDGDLHSFVAQLSVWTWYWTPINATCYLLGSSICCGFQWRYKALSIRWWQGLPAKRGVYLA